MIGKLIKINDYKFTYGQETVFINVYGAFKNKKSGNKYVIYSYDNSKLYYGSLFIRDSEMVIMVSKEEVSDVIKEFTYSILDDKKNTDFEIISLDNVDSAQIIDESLCDFDVDMNKLYDLTIPKPEVKKEEVKPKKRISVVGVSFGLFVVVVILFLFMNPEIIYGENKEYICVKSYLHDKLPATVNEEVELIFNGKNDISSIKTKFDYVFSDTDYYKEFRDKSYFYQYFNEGDTYKFDDDKYTYRLFSNINTEEDYFMPRELEELVSYYEGNGYSCKVAEVE